MFLILSLVESAVVVIAASVLSQWMSWQVAVFIAVPVVTLFFSWMVASGGAFE